MGRGSMTHEHCNETDLPVVCQILNNPLLHEVDMCIDKLGTDPHVRVPSIRFSRTEVLEKWTSDSQAQPARICYLFISDLLTVRQSSRSACAEK